jgi:hypothetical protein
MLLEYDYSLRCNLSCGLYVLRNLLGVCHTIDSPQILSCSVYSIDGLSLPYGLHFMSHLIGSTALVRLWPFFW